MQTLLTFSELTTSPIDTIYDGGGPAGNYGNNDDWVQIIRCDSQKVVTLQILEFDLGKSDAVGQTDCDVDTLAIYAGAAMSLGALLFKSICPPISVSVSSPLFFITQSREVSIKFNSDSTITGAGYAIKYMCSTPVESLPDSGGTIYDTGGAFSSYSNNEYTVAKLDCPVGLKTSIEFAHLDIDGSMPDCITDSVTIYGGYPIDIRGVGYDVQLVGTYCGFLEGAALPTAKGDNVAIILFRSDSSITKAGYSLNYNCVFEGTGQENCFFFRCADFQYFISHIIFTLNISTCYSPFLCWIHSIRSYAQ
jgi:hypothetical protein